MSELENLAFYKHFVGFLSITFYAQKGRHMSERTLPSVREFDDPDKM